MHILITGIGSQFAQLVGAVLAARPNIRVSAVGAPSMASTTTLASTTALAATIGPMPHGQALVDLVRGVAPDLVLHLDQPGEEQAGARAGQLQTAELLAACAAAKTPRVVLRSSSYVYGAWPDNPAFIAESQLPHEADSPGLQSDYVAIERFASEYARRNPASQVAILRCAPLVGSGVDSPMQRYLYQPRPLIMAGFDPRMQLLHTDDAVVAFALATLSSSHGAYNIAAPDILSLSQIIRRAGRQPLALGKPAFSGVRLVAPITGPIRAALPFDPAFLQYACVADTRRAITELGWQPQHIAAEALTR